MTRFVLYFNKEHYDGYEVSGHSTNDANDEEGRLVCSAVSMDTEIAKLNGKIRKRESEIEQAKEYCCDVLCLYRESWEGDNESLIEERCNKCRMSNL